MTNHRHIATVLLAVVGALSSAGTAAADPPPDAPVDPVVPVPPNSTLLGPLAQSDGPAGLGGMPADVTGNALLLGQTANPALPGTDPGVPPALNGLNNAYLLPQNVEPAAPGEGTVFGVAPGAENTDISRLDYLRRLHAYHQEGGLMGALLGQTPGPIAPEPRPAP